MSTGKFIHIFVEFLHLSAVKIYDKGNARNNLNRKICQTFKCNCCVGVPTAHTVKVFRKCIPLPTRYHKNSSNFYAPLMVVSI
jgi:hypothetical protein